MGTKKTDLQLDCMEMQKYRTAKKLDYNSPFFRKPYQYTSAECKDDTQEKLHEYDYLK